jgi:hypothetical protein
VSDYPNVECTLHPSFLEPGYVVCRHIGRHTAKPSFVEASNEERCGVLMCEECERENPKMTQHNFFLTCAQCCRDQGWIE